MAKNNLTWTTAQRKVSELHGYEYNPRKLTDEQEKQLKKSLKKFNLVEIPAIDLDNTIVAGHQRVKVLSDLGRHEEVIDVRVPSRKLTEDEFKEYCLRSNKNTGEWDFDILNEQFDHSMLSDVGFLDDELNGISEGTADCYDDSEDVTPLKYISSLVTLGDVFEIGRHRLICGDSTDEKVFAQLFNTDIANMIFTDPPYGIDYESEKHGKIKNDNLKGNDLYLFIKSSFSNAFKYTADNIGIYCWYDDKFRYIFQKALEDSGFDYKQNLIWNKGMVLSGFDYKQNLIWNKGMVLSGFDYQKAHEQCLYLQKNRQKAQWFGGRDKKTILGLRRTELLDFKKEQLVQMLISMQSESTVWDIDRDLVTEYQHPTQKPLTLSMRAIANSTDVNDIVLDMFLGSGSAMVASHRLGRICYGIELDTQYCDVIIRRMLLQDKNLKVTKNGEEVTSLFLAKIENE